MSLLKVYTKEDFQVEVPYWDDEPRRKYRIEEVGYDIPDSYVPPEVIEHIDAQIKIKLFNEHFDQELKDYLFEIIKNAELIDDYIIYDHLYLDELEYHLNSEVKSLKNNILYNSNKTKHNIINHYLELLKKVNKIDDQWESVTNQFENFNAFIHTKYCAYGERGHLLVLKGNFSIKQFYEDLKEIKSIILRVKQSF